MAHGYCKNICQRVFQTGKGDFNTNKKYCAVCAVYMGDQKNSLNCQCCKTKLRVNTRGNSKRNKLRRDSTRI